MEPPYSLPPTPTSPLFPEDIELPPSRSSTSSSSTRSFISDKTICPIPIFRPSTPLLTRLQEQLERSTSPSPDEPPSRPTSPLHTVLQFLSLSPDPDSEAALEAERRARLKAEEKRNREIREGENKWDGILDGWLRGVRMQGEGGLVGKGNEIWENQDEWGKGSWPGTHVALCGCGLCREHSEEQMELRRELRKRSPEARKHLRSSTAIDGLWWAP
jgi:hypothetical protein